jgi:DNA-directed RNA polymerase sigma subunit (sigma70/sigma32)
MSYQEIASELGLSIVRVKQIESIALRKLRCNGDFIFLKQYLEHECKMNSYEEMETN